MDLTAQTQSQGPSELSMENSTTHNDDASQIGSPSKPPTSSNTDRSASPEGPRPPLPPRPGTLSLLDEGAASSRSTQTVLQSRATTAVSLTDIASREGGKESHAGLNTLGALKAKASLSHLASPKGSETGDSASIRSFIPYAETSDVENVFSDFNAADPGAGQQDSTGLLQFPEFQADDVEDDFVSEFERVGEVGDEGEHEGRYHLLFAWIIR